MPISRLRLEVRYVLSWLAHLIARSAPSCNPTIAFLLPVYQWDVVSTSEARSWFNLGQAVCMLFFLSVPMKILCPYKKNSWERS